MLCVIRQTSDLCVTVKINKYHLVKSQDLDFNLLTACLEVLLLFIVILKGCRFHQLSLGLSNFML